jgi:competence protein ComEA
MHPFCGKTARQTIICRAAGVMCLGLLVGGAALFATTSSVQALAGDLARVKAASTLDSDPADAVAVTQVCTVCHVSTQFLSTPRFSSRWQEVFTQMSGYGATGTDDQLDRVVSYFQKNLTVVNVNTSPAEDLGPTLQVSDAVIDAILARRAQRPFSGIDDLSKIPGVDRSILEKLSAKNCLQFQS